MSRHLNAVSQASPATSPAGPPWRRLAHGLLRIAAVLACLAAWQSRVLAAEPVIVDAARLGAGLWEDPAAPGQRIALQPLPAAGGGQLFGVWYTYTFTVGTGASDAQRWYSLQGALPAPGGTAMLRLFETTQGDFDHASAVVTRDIGQATLAFSDCTHATLTWSLDADATRHGTLALVRSSGAGADCAAATPAAPAAGIVGLGGAWYNPATSGQGLFVEFDAQRSELRAGWSTYVPQADTASSGSLRERWFSLRTAIADIGTLPAIPIVATTGGTQQASDAKPASATLGEATLAFVDCDHARLDYRFDSGEYAGLSGSIALRHLRTDASCTSASFNLPGHVDLPAGIDAASVRVLGAFSETTPDANGDFHLPRTGGAPSLSGAVGPDGVLQLGMLDTPAAVALRFDARSSAIALLFQAIGGTTLTVEQRRQVIALIDADAGTTALAAVIAAEQARDAYVLEHLTAPILDNLATIVRGWTPPASVVAALRSTLRSFGALARPFARVTAAATASSDDSGALQQLLLTNEPEQSGFTLLLNDDNAGVTIQNIKRRPGAVHVFTTGYTDSDGNHVDLTSVAPQGEKVPVPATRRLSTASAFSSIASLLAAVLRGDDVAIGTIPWAPVNSAPIPIKGVDGAVTTDVDVVVLAGIWNGDQPAWPAAYANETGVLANDVFLLRAKQMFDATIMALLENLGLGGGAVSDLPEATVEDLILHGVGIDFDTILADIRAGTSFDKAFRGLLSWYEPAQLEAMFEEEAYIQALHEYAQLSEGVDVINFAAREKYLAEHLAAAATDSRNKLLNTSKRTLFAVTAILAGADTLAQGIDQYQGHVANTYKVKVIRPILRLDPRSSEIGLGETVNLHASVRGFDDDASISFGWTLDSDDQSVLDDGHGARVAGSGSFDSDSHDVSFITGELITRSDIPHRVTVQAFHKDKNGAYELFGEVTASISITGYAVQLVPDQVSMRHDGTRTFGIGIDPFPDDATLAALQFEWSSLTQGRCGTLTSAGQSVSAAQPVVTTTSAHATYAGDASVPSNCPGDTVHVTLFTMRDGVRKTLGGAEAIITFTDFDIALSNTPSQRPGASTTISAALLPPPPADAHVVWHWSVTGDGSVQSQTDTGVIGSSIVFQAGNTAGSARVVVTADVTLANGLVEHLPGQQQTIQIFDDGIDSLTTSPIQFYTTATCSVAYVTLPRLPNRNFLRVTSISGAGTLGNGPTNTTGGTTVMEPLHAFVGMVDDIFDTPVDVSCFSTPLNSSILGTASSLRIVVARALIIDGSPTPDWTAAWESEFRAAYGNLVIGVDLFHADVP